MTNSTRRDFFKRTLAVPVGAGLVALAGTVLLEPTPAVADDDEPVTPEDVEGPYFKAKSPERKNLIEEGIPGEKMKLKGFVWNRKKEPVKGALIDIWHCDGKGVYDNDTFKLRGHQFSADDGGYVLDTILPGLYTGRTRHIHVKVQAPGKKILTTQLYFPGEEGNKKDRLYKPKLELKWTDATAKAAEFHFVLDV